MLIDKIKSDWIAARKNKDERKTRVLGFLYSTINNKTKEKGFSDEYDMIAVVKNLIKKSTELQNFHEDTVAIDDVSQDINILNSYLPEVLDREELSDIIDAEIEKNSTVATIMKNLKNNFGHTVDMQLAMKIIKEKAA